MPDPYRKIRQHFQQKDPIVAPIIATLDIDEWRHPLTDPEQFFPHITRSIIAQQLGTKVASTITGRFRALFPNEVVTPEALLALEDQTLRDVGLSWAKIRYVKDLAQKTQEQKIRYAELPTLEDEEVILELTQVKGIGRWTAEMFLMFALGREDLFSYGDLGLKRGMQKLYGLSELPTEAEALRITEFWKPYRSYGCFALWQSLE